MNCAQRLCSANRGVFRNARRRTRFSRSRKQHTSGASSYWRTTVLSGKGRRKQRRWRMRMCWTRCWISCGVETRLGDDRGVRGGVGSIEWQSRRRTTRQTLRGTCLRSCNRQGSLRQGRRRQQAREGRPGGGGGGLRRRTSRVSSMYVICKRLSQDGVTCGGPATLRFASSALP